MIWQQKSLKVGWSLKGSVRPCLMLSQNRSAPEKFWLMTDTLLSVVVLQSISWHESFFLQRLDGMAIPSIWFASMWSFMALFIPSFPHTLHCWSVCTLHHLVKLVKISRMITVVFSSGLAILFSCVSVLGVALVSFVLELGEGKTLGDTYCLPTLTFQ